MPLGITRKCLLVKRFDINKAGDRYHLVSIPSLLKADGYYNAGHQDLAEIIKHISSQPGQDLYRRYRQLVFNGMIDNTDDHLKNFLMLLDDTGWRLSPAFDFIPNIGFNHEHVLRIELDYRPPDIEAFLAEDKLLGNKRRQQVMDLAGEVYLAVFNWSTVFAEYKCAGKGCRKYWQRYWPAAEKNR